MNSEYFASKWIEVDNDCMLTKILKKGEIDYIKCVFSFCGFDNPLPKENGGC